MAYRRPDLVRIGITWQEPAMMQIGKGGLSEGVIKEARRLVNAHKYIKVRLHASCLEEHSKEEIFHTLCVSIGAQLAGIRGNTAVIYKLKKKRERHQSQSQTRDGRES